jgi:hypothetical protein
MVLVDQAIEARPGPCSSLRYVQPGRINLRGQEFQSPKVGLGQALGHRSALHRWSRRRL